MVFGVTMLKMQLTVEEGGICSFIKHPKNHRYATFINNLHFYIILCQKPSVYRTFSPE